METIFNEKIRKERKGKSGCCRLRYIWEDWEEKDFAGSSLSPVWDLCILFQKKVAEGAVSLDLY